MTRPSIKMRLALLIGHEFAMVHRMCNAQLALGIMVSLIMGACSKSQQTPSASAPNATQPSQHSESTQIQSGLAPNHENGAQRHMHHFSFEELVARFESPERTEWQRPDELIAHLKPNSTKRVVDLGAGSGYFTFRLAAHAEQVLAVDIDSRFIEYLERRKASDPNGGHVTVRSASPEDPELEPGYWDLALIVDVYHHIDHRVAWLEKVRHGLRDKGRVVVVDFKQGDFPDAPPEHLRLAPDLVRRELEQAGFTDVTVDEKLLPRQYVVSGEVRAKY